MSTMIEKALATASAVTELGEIDRLAKEEDRLRMLKETLLPIEKEAREEIDQRIEQHEARRLQVSTAQKLEGLPRLDPDVFSWTKSQQAWQRLFRGNISIEVPVFAYIPVRMDSCQLQIGWATRSFSASSGVIRSVRNRYETIMEKIRDKHLSWEGRESVTLSYAYPGVVPNHVRETIKREGVDRRFSELALVCEVDAWKITSVMTPPRDYLDPILVGVCNSDLWVIETFDPTPVESYLLDEFSS